MLLKEPYPRILIYIVSLIAVGWFAFNIEIPYNISSKGYFMPDVEYNISRTVEGNLISSLINHRTDAVEKYSVTEFQRGDVVELTLAPNITANSKVSKGDTLGFVSSNEELRNLIDLEGQLGILKAELEFFTTGQKPEDILLALNQLELAEQDFATQQILMARTEKLLRDGAISQQEYDIEQNLVKVKEVTAKIARANWQSLSTGEKPEQEKLTLAQIASVMMQIELIKKRLQSLTIISPISGKILLYRDLQLTGQIMTVADTTAIVALIPIPYKEKNYLEIGNLISWTGENGVLSKMDLAVKILDFKEAFYITAVFPYTSDFMSGNMGNVKIHSGKITPIRYLGRIFGFENTRAK